MQLLTSQQVQTGFGKFADLVKQQGSEPVIITQRKRPTMAVFRYDEAMEMMRLSAKCDLFRRCEKMPKIAESRPMKKWQS
ncbi:Uncharacterised protein [Moraxella caprae]|uniref:Antitoxin n=1 Tax=Moraxella caprae TaxID=90240 RepID=A0A378U5H0_9GAMM|nr:Uncharacterised protein [Moraxella caprae]